MATIQDALAARYAPTAKETAIRQESGLNEKQVGEPDLERLDSYILRRINARCDRLTGILQKVAGPAFVWPFTAPQLLLAYPSQDEAGRANTLRLQMETAADAVIAGVLGDLFARAAPRDEKYRESRDFYLGSPDDPADTGEVGRLVKDLKEMVASALQPGETPNENRARLVIVSLRGDEDEDRSQYAPTRPRSDLELRRNEAGFRCW